MSSFQILLFFIFFSVSLVYTNALVDTLTQNQSLSDGQTLVSAGKMFELGFFSPGNSTNKYVGIWYYNIAPQTVVWVANREAPITSANGQLNVSSSGNIVIVDGVSGSTIWTSNSSSSDSKNSSLKLSDVGNLVVQLPDGTVLWQSFDYPTDTFLPGMEVLLNETTGIPRLYTSWRSPDDPSPGNYTLGLDPRGSAQIFIWDGGAPRWRSGQWNGQVFIGTKFRPLYIYGFKFINDDNQQAMYYTFTASNTSLLRFVMQWNGNERTSMFVQQTREWEAVFEQPETVCQEYGKCGNYGICTDGNTPMCSCLDGFQPKNSTEWNNGIWSGGCIRKTPLASCSNITGNGFLRVAGTKLPDLSDWASNVVTDTGCETACTDNCSCIAYAYVTGIGCMLWAKDLIDIYQFPTGGNDLFLKLASSELNNFSQGIKHNSRKALIAVYAVCSFLVILCALLLWKCRSRIKGSWNKWRQPDQPMLSRTTMSVSKEFSSTFSDTIVDDKEGQKELPLYTFETVATATNNFSDSNKLGAGGFGIVYKGTLACGQEVAVKRLSKSSGQGLEEFKNEVIVIAKLQHRNLVRLLGCCIKGDEKILLYEYMPRNSLDALLFDPTNKASLDWKTRFDIVEGIARGLLYLHRDSRLRIIHRDLKASNILLDAELNPKISDFGMARIIGGDDNQGNTMRVVGTFGYMAPEYAMEGLFSVKSDVYSFGILVLEIVTGQKNKSFNFDGNSMNIVGYAWKLWNEDKAFELIDQSIRMSCKMQQVLKCIHIGLLCVQDRADDRPDMASVVLVLGSESNTLPMPRQPTFTLGGRRHHGDEVPHESLSANDYTITGVQAR